MEDGESWVQRLEGAATLEELDQVEQEARGKQFSWADGTRLQAIYGRRRLELLGIPMPANLKAQNDALSRRSTTDERDRM